MQQKLRGTEQKLTDVASAERLLREENSRMHAELEQIKLQFELEKLRTMEALRAEHQRQLEWEIQRAEELRLEKKRSDERAIHLESQLFAFLQQRDRCATGGELRSGAVSPYPSVVSKEEPRCYSPAPVTLHFSTLFVQQTCFFL